MSFDAISFSFMGTVGWFQWLTNVMCTNNTTTISMDVWSYPNLLSSYIFQNNTAENEVEYYSMTEGVFLRITTKIILDIVFLIDTV